MNSFLKRIWSEKPTLLYRQKSSLSMSTVEWIRRCGISSCSNTTSMRVVCVNCFGWNIVICYKRREITANINLKRSDIFPRFLRTVTMLMMWGMVEDEKKTGLLELRISTRSSEYCRSNSRWENTHSIFKLRMVACAEYSLRNRSIDNDKASCSRRFAPLISSC